MPKRGREERQRGEPPPLGETSDGGPILSTEPNLWSGIKRVGNVWERPLTCSGRADASKQSSTNGSNRVVWIAVSRISVPSTLTISTVARRKATFPGWYSSAHQRPAFERN
jgi:hypothetical protein